MANEKIRTHTPVEGYKIEDLKAKPVAQLIQIATKLGVENPQEYLRQDLIFEILKTQVTQGGYMLFTGILEITPDGHGFCALQAWAIAKTIPMSHRAKSADLR